MICQLEGLSGSSYNGKPAMRTGDKSPERSGWELAGVGRFGASGGRSGYLCSLRANNARGRLFALALCYATTHEAGEEGRLAVLQLQAARQHLLQPRAARTPAVAGVVFERGGADVLRPDRVQLGPARNFSQHDQEPRRRQEMSSYEMEMEDFLIDLKRKVAVVEQQNQDLREVNSRLTLALDEALAMARKYRGGNQEGEEL
jgi:hypothetical protein